MQIQFYEIEKRLNAGLGEDNVYKPELNEKELSYNKEENNKFTKYEI